jgi:nicotinamide riboside transporter PnuC|tara:strand:+ start:1216 stop:1464 length:249 start_codon:yes stop_codon:yes gene_type:complete
MKSWFESNSEPLNWKLIGWIGAGLVIFGYYLNANGYITSWLIWIAGNIMVGVYSVYKKAYSTAIMSFILTIMNIYGYIRWLS